MELNENTAELVLDLEDIIGNCCYNGDSYNGWTKEYGCSFRYPVTYTTTNGDTDKTRYFFTNIDLNKVDEMHYKFGANQLYIGAGILKMLNSLEKHFDLNFEELLKEKGSLTE